MTDEKKRRAAPVVMLMVCVVLWLALFGLGIWSAQTDNIGWAYFYAIVTMAPALGAYEILRRWNRG